MNDAQYASMSKTTRALVTRDALRTAGLTPHQIDAAEEASVVSAKDRLQMSYAVAAIAEHIKLMASQLCDAEYVFDSDLSDQDVAAIVRSLDRVAREMEG